MGTALLLYLLYSGFAVGLCLWAATTAVQPIQEHKTVHRWLTLAPALMLPPAVLTATLAHPFGRPELLLALLFVPPLTIAAMVSAGMTLAGQGFIRRLLHFPVTAWNATLAVIYLLRAGLELGGTDIATEALALVDAHAHFQRYVGQIDALAAPFWFHLPLLIPLWLRYGPLHDLLLVVTALLASAMLGLLALQMPWALEQVDSYRGGQDQTVVLRGDLAVGVSLPVRRDTAAPWAPSLDEATSWSERVAMLEDLDPDIVAVDIGPGTVSDEREMGRLITLRAACKAIGRDFVVTVHPPREYLSSPAPDLATLSAAAAEARWAAAEQLRPDLLILHAGPYDSLARSVAEPITIDTWIDRLERDAEEVGKAASNVPVGVAIVSRATHAEELYRRLAKGDASPIDAIALTLRPERMSLGEVRTALDTWREWTTRIPTDREVWIVGVGAVPAVVGGEFGQWMFMREILAFASDVERVRGVVFDGLVDTRDGSRGLTAAFGRERLAFEWLRRHIEHRRNPPPAHPTPDPSRSPAEPPR